MGGLLLSAFVALPISCSVSATAFRDKVWACHRWQVGDGGGLVNVGGLMMMAGLPTEVVGLSFCFR